MPNAEASRVVSVSTGTNPPVLANIVVQTQAVAVKEGGLKETVARFGEGLCLFTRIHCRAS
jgi:hypothetical protein